MPDTSTKYTNATGIEDAREVVRLIAERIKGIGPGFLVRISCRPGQWQSLLDAIPGPEETPDLLTCLKAVVADILEYERVNNLAPNPGRKYCWDSVEQAMAAIAKTTA